jgi:hypothetical protein
MKKIYQKPTLVKVQRLAMITAQQVIVCVSPVHICNVHI